MKLEYEVLQKILEEVEETTDGISLHLLDTEEADDYPRKAYHCKILINEGLIDGEVQGVSHITFSGLTLAGHQTLEAMKNKTVWEGIKKTAHGLGIETLKQIPALAVKLFTT